MTNDEILEAAVEELGKLQAPKLWMTERGLAKRLRRRAALRGLDHVQLRGVLMEHAKEAPRKLRNSAAPSMHTLEVLWGAIRPGGIAEANVLPPILTGGPAHVDPASEPENSAFDEDEEAADYFLSYRMADEENARDVVRAVEHSGSSVWDAGTFIVDGEHINDRVVEAMGQVHKQLIYLSESALCSLWVSKEVIYGDHLDLEQTIVLKGDDDLLMDCVYQMLEKKAPDFPPYRGETSKAVERFRQMLQSELTKGSATVFLHPLPNDDRWRQFKRLKPVRDFTS